MLKEDERWKIEEGRSKKEDSEGRWKKEDLPAGRQVQDFMVLFRKYEMNPERDLEMVSVLS